jgi:hypothetical protein
MITSISNITEQYLRRMVMESQAREMAKDQRYAAMMNVAFVLDNVVPRISSQLNVSGLAGMELKNFHMLTAPLRNSDTLTVLYQSSIH